MSDEDDWEQPVMTRREALKGGSAAAVAVGASMYSDALIQAASAQSTEPRIALGSDWEFQDDPNGSGHLGVEHTPNSNSFTFQDDGVLSVDALNYTSLGTTEFIGSDSDGASLSVSITNEYNIISIYVGQFLGTSATDIELVLDGDDASGNYEWIDFDGTNQTGQNTFRLYDFSDNVAFGTVIKLTKIQNNTWGITHFFGALIPGRVNSIGFGGRYKSSIGSSSSVELRGASSSLNEMTVWGQLKQ